VNEVGNLNDTFDLFLINTEDVLDRFSESEVFTSFTLKKQEETLAYLEESISSHNQIENAYVGFEETAQPLIPTHMDEGSDPRPTSGFKLAKKQNEKTSCPAP